MKTVKVLVTSTYEISGVTHCDTLAELTMSTPDNTQAVIDSLRDLYQKYPDGDVTMTVTTIAEYLNI